MGPTALKAGPFALVGSAAADHRRKRTASLVELARQVRRAVVPTSSIERLERLALLELLVRRGRGSDLVFPGLELMLLGRVLEGRLSIIGSEQAEMTAVFNAFVEQLSATVVSTNQWEI